jgi:hypothetical protein
VVVAGEAAIVTTVTPTVAAADPFSKREPGDTAHVDCGGAPVQAKATDWLNPPPPETEREKFAVSPAETVADVGEPGAIEKSCPVPVSATVCGLPEALSVIVNVPSIVPLAVGSKKTPTAQLAPAARVLPQALSTAKSPGLADTLVMLTEELPVFVTVTL